jgi:hypothetical protein
LQFSIKGQVNMKPFTLAIVTLMAIVALVMGMAVMEPVTEKGTVPLSVNAFPTGYSLAMSFAPGIQLTPVYPTTVDNSTVSFRWQTNYGQFLSWNAPDYKIVELGKDLTAGDGKTCWSYANEGDQQQRPPVHIILTMIDKASGQTLGTASLDIGWGEHDFAVVRT